MALIKEILSLLKDTFKAWQAARASRMAAALAYYSLFALAPLLIIALSITGLVFGEQAAEHRLANRIEGLAGAQAAEQIERLVENMDQSASGVWGTVLGVGAMLVGASNLFAQLQGALNRIWRVPPPAEGGLERLVRRRLLAFGMVLGTGGLLLLTLLVGTAVRWVTDSFALGGLLEWLNQLLSFLLTLAAFGLLFKLLPEAPVGWREAWLGALVTALLFAAGRWAISFYLGRAGVGSAYGAAGSLVVLLVWVYYSAQILLLGAEFTRLVGQRILNDETSEVSDASEVSP